MSGVQVQLPLSMLREGECTTCAGKKCVRAHIDRCWVVFFCPDCEGTGKQVPAAKQEQIH